MYIEKLKANIKKFMLGDDGISTIEIILIIVIVIGLVIIFRDQMTSLVNRIFNSITNKTGNIIR